MGIAERRERERQELRGKILDAARDLFARDGYERVTMRGIAEAIEYSPTTIYHHFKDKEELVQCLCEDDFSQLLGALQGQEVPEDPVEWIRQLGLGYARFGLQHPNQYRFMFMTPSKPEDKRPGSGDEAYLVLRSAVERALESGRFRPGNVDTVAQVLWAALHGAVALLINCEPQMFPAPPAPDLVEQVIENNIRGFLVRSEEKDSR
ncbi:MAG: TetR/AcrR family transcriptional regulator [Acidobacteriota bacterium]